MPTGDEHRGSRNHNAWNIAPAYFTQQPIDNILSAIDGSCRIAVEVPCQWGRRQARVRTENVRVKRFHPAMKFADFRRRFAALSAKSGSVRRTPKTNSGTRACCCQVSTKQTRVITQCSDYLAPRDLAKTFSSGRNGGVRAFGQRRPRQVFPRLPAGDFPPSECTRTRTAY